MSRKTNTYEEKKKRNTNLNSLQAVRRFLSKKINEYDDDKLVTEKAKTLATMCNTMIKCLQASIEENDIAEIKKKLEENGMGID